MQNYAKLQLQHVTAMLGYALLHKYRAAQGSVNHKDSKILYYTLYRYIYIYVYIYCILLHIMCVYMYIYIYTIYIYIYPFSPQFTKLPRFSAQKLCTACGMLPREQTPQNYAICTEVWQPPNEPNFSDLSGSATGRAGPEKLLDNWWFAHLQGITVHPFSPQFTKLPRFSAQKLCTAPGMLPREQTPQNYAICTGGLATSK